MGGQLHSHIREEGTGGATMRGVVGSAMGPRRRLGVSKTSIPPQRAWWRGLTLALLASSATLGAIVPAAAAEGQSITYATEVQSRAFETYQQLPYEINQGAPSGWTGIYWQGSPACRAISGLVDDGSLGDIVTLFTDQTYQNPTRMRAGNQAGGLPERAEFGARPGPHALAACPAPESGVGSATTGGYVSEQVSIESATSKSTAEKLDGEPTVINEALTRLQGLHLGEVSIRHLESWIRVEWRLEQEPVISYRMVLSGLVTDGTEVWSNDDHGSLILQGQNVGGSEFVEQFNEQTKAHESDLEELGTYRLRLLEPRVYEDRRFAKTVIENFALEAGFGLAARKGEQFGSFQGMRLARAKIRGSMATF